MWQIEIFPLKIYWIQRWRLHQWHSSLVVQVRWHFKLRFLRTGQHRVLYTVLITGRRGHDCMEVEFTTTCTIVPKATKVVSPINDFKGFLHIFYCRIRHFTESLTEKLLRQVGWQGRVHKYSLIGVPHWYSHGYFCSFFIDLNTLASGTMTSGWQLSKSE
jgi:hypothetical protein